MQLGWLALFFAAYFGFVGLYSPFLGPYLQSLGHGLDVVAFSLGMMQIMRIFGPFAWGWLADRTGQRVRWIRLGALGGTACTALAFTWQGDGLWFLLGVLLINAFISGLVPMSDAYAMERCNGQAGLYGRVRLFGSVGFVVAVLLFGAVAQVYGYASYPFLAVAVLGLAFVAAMRFQPDHIERDKRAPKMPFQQVLHRLLVPHGLPFFWGAAFFMILAHGVFYGYFSLYLLEFGFPEFSIGLLWAFGVMCEVVFFALQARFFHRLSLRAWLLVSFVACAVRFFALALLPGFWPVVLLTQGLHALTFAAHHTATVTWLRVNMPHSLVVRSQAMYATIAYGLGGTTGTLVGRVAWEYIAPQAAFGLAGLSALLAVWMGLKFRAFEKLSNLEPKGV